MQSNQYTLITGATSGIGLATARQLHKIGHRIIAVGRRGDRLQAVGKELGCLTFAVDVADPQQCEQFFKEQANLLKNVSVLVNNAGLAAGTEKLQESKPQDWDRMIDTNVKGLLRFTRAVLPNMLEKNHGDIVNIGSVAGRWSYSGGAVYCATKFAVRAISESIRMDVLGKNIRVVNVEPGMVETEFSVVRLGSQDQAKKVYEGMQPLTADDIADSITWALTRPRHVNVQELVLFPTDQAAVGQVHRK